MLSYCQYFACSKYNHLVVRVPGRWRIFPGTCTSRLAPVRVSVCYRYCDIRFTAGLRQGSPLLVKRQRISGYGRPVPLRRINTTIHYWPCVLSAASRPYRSCRRSMGDWERHQRAEPHYRGRVLHCPVPDPHRKWRGPPSVHRLH